MLLVDYCLLFVVLCERFVVRRLFLLFVDGCWLVLCDVVPRALRVVVFCCVLLIACSVLSVVVRFVLLVVC